MHDDLLEQARLLLGTDPRKPRQANLRRAVSSAYYALFHMLAAEAAQQLLRGMPHAGRYRRAVARALVHEKMKKASVAFAATNLKVIGAISPSADLKRVAEAFWQLQQARHWADYDLTRRVTKQEAGTEVELAARAIAAWKKARSKDPLARLFLVLLVVYDDLDRR